MNISSKISNLRRSRDLTQKESSDRIGINQSVLNRIEKGTRPIRDDELKSIADHFNVSADYLLGRQSTNKISLSREQKNLLNGFDGLNDEGKKAIMVLIGQLNFARASTPMTALAV